MEIENDLSASFLALWNDESRRTLAIALAVIAAISIGWNAGAILAGAPPDDLLLRFVPTVLGPLTLLFVLAADAESDAE